jgi:hypothetical protein
MRLFLIATTVVTICLGTLARAQTCADATEIGGLNGFVSDTAHATDWMLQFGPLSSVGSNDNLYKFTAPAQPLGFILPTASSYTFAMYLIPSCSDGGNEPSPIRATSTVGRSIDLGDPPPAGQPSIMAGERYYLAVTGTAAAPGAGTVDIEVQIIRIPVTLQSFTIE